MTPGQAEFLQDVAQKIPRLFAAIAEGNVRAEFILGQRMMRGRQVRLKLIAEVVDPGSNPLSTHSKPGHTQAGPADSSTVDGMQRNAISGGVSPQI